MNLLTDKWIPVQIDGKRQLVRLQDVLCGEHNWQLSLPRDDMELACLQLMICLTQVMFRPENPKALKHCICEPMSKEEYQEGIADYLDWFDLNHPDTPFMQVRGVKTAKATPIQKLFVGLPEGNNHCFFNDAGELKAVGESAVAIALFNQAMNCPSMGGGFKGGFRGSAPVTTLIYGDDLRQRIWFNILHEESLRLLMPKYDELKENDKPVWVEQIKAKSSITASSIGLLRGLFWQPAHIELIFSNAGQCDLYGSDEDSLLTGFNKEKFVYEIIGQWVHPHSPRYWYTTKQGKKEEKYVSFRTMAPAWGQLSHFIIDKHGQNEGQQVASVVSQFKAIASAQKCHLIVGGYRNRQASIIQRRHELLPLAEGWENHSGDLFQLVDAALNLKRKMVQSLCLFGVTAGAAKRNRKRNKSITPNGLVKCSSNLDKYPFDDFEDFFDGIHQHAEALFYHNSEHLIHESLRQMDWREAKKVKENLVKKLIQLSWQIFREVTNPYQHEPKMILAIAVAKRTLGREFKKIDGGVI